MFAVSLPRDVEFHCGLLLCGDAAEVAIRLMPKTDAPAMSSAKEHAAALGFLKQLCGKSALAHVIPYEDWMSSRSRVRLLGGYSS